MNAADLFRAMADRIERQAEGDFGGAVLCVPPSGEPLQILISDPEQSHGHFWNLCKIRIEIALANVVEAERLTQMSPYGRR